CREHAADDGRPHYFTGYGAGSAGKGQGNTTEDKREGGHQDRTEPEPRSGKRGVRQIFAPFVLAFCKFHDQYRVFRGQPYQDYQPDLRVNVENHSASQKCRKRSKHGNGCAKQDAEGQGPTLIKGGEYEE